MRNYLIIVIFFAAFIYLYSVNSTIYVEPDTWYYLIISKSYSVGNGHRVISDPDNPIENVILPLYPLMLVPVFWFAEGSFLIARLISAGIAILSVYLFYLISKEFFDNRLAIITTAIISLSPMVVIYSHKILTEIPYMFFSLLTVYLIFKYYEKNDLKSYFFVLPLLLSLFTKIFGIILITSIIIYFVLKKDFKKIIIISCIFLFFMDFLYLIEYYHFFSTNHEGYTITDELTGKRVMSNSSFLRFMTDRAYGGIFGYYGIHIPTNIMTILSMMWDNESLSILSLIIGFIISAMVILGYFIEIKNKITIFTVYVLIHSFVCTFLIQTTGNGRYMLPILPFIIIYFTIGLRRITSSIIVPYTKYTFFILAISMLLLSTVLSAILLSNSSHNKENPKMYDNLLVTAQWIKSNVNSSEVIATDFIYTPAVYILAGNKAILISNNQKKLYDDITKYDITYLLISNEDNIEKYMLLKIYNLELVFSTDDSNIRVYRLDNYRPNIL